MRPARMSLLAAILVSGCGGGSSCESLAASDASFWRSSELVAEGDALDRRRDIADRIERCGLLTGKTRADVRRLLGEPESRDTANERTYWYYTVGPERGAFSVDGEVLAVSFRDRRVAGVSVDAT